jgi:hypothetical protein
MTPSGSRRTTEVCPAVYSPCGSPSGTRHAPALKRTTSMMCGISSRMAGRGLPVLRHSASTKSSARSEQVGDAQQRARPRPQEWRRARRGTRRRGRERGVEVGAPGDRRRVVRRAGAGVDDVGGRVGERWLSAAGVEVVEHARTLGEDPQQGWVPEVTAARSAIVASRPASR